MGEGLLEDFYFHDPRVVLVPAEHLGDGGMDAEFAASVQAIRGWSAERVALFDAGWSRYRGRSADLARRTRTWVAPRRRNVVVVEAEGSVRPYVQLLNTSAWMLYGADVEPETSTAELLAYLLALGDRMALTGEVATAPVQTAAWWIERTDEECAEFADGAVRSTRPDASAYVAVAEALPWLRQLHHETLRPAERPARTRGVPGTGLLVPAALEGEPPRLVGRWKRIATAALAAHRAAWRRRDPALVANLCEWLAADRPPLVVAADGGRVLWEPEAPDRVGALRSALRDADAAAVERVHRDLERVGAVTRRFLAAVVDPASLPPPAGATLQTGYVYLDEARRLVAYNLHEPGMERLAGPALPYEHPMVGARAAHEWAHLADAAGFVPRVASAEDWAALRSEFASMIEAVVARAPGAVRQRTAGDLAALADGRPPGMALCRLLLARLPDYRANLVARAVVTDVEAETYVRHNVRSLGADHGPDTVWRLLVRYLFEYQYLLPPLGFTRMRDPRAYLVATTGIAAELFDGGAVDEEAFDALAAVVGRLCACHAIDPTKLRFA